MLSIDKTTKSLVGLGRGKATFSISADVANRPTVNLTCAINVVADGSTNLEVASGRTIKVDTYSCKFNAVSVDGTLVISGDGQMFDAKTVAVSGNGKIIFNGSGAKITIAKITGNVASDPLSYENGAKASNVTISNTDDFTIGGKVIVRNLTLNSLSLNFADSVSLDKLLSLTPSSGDYYTLLWDTATTTNAKVLSIDKTTGSLVGLGCGTVTFSISANLFNSGTVSRSCTIKVVADGTTDLVVESGKTVTIDAYSCKFNAISIDGTLIVSGDGQMLDAKTVTIGSAGKIIVRGSGTKVTLTKVTGDVSAIPFSYENDAKASNVTIGNTSDFTIGGKAIATSLKLNDLSMAIGDNISLDKLITATPLSSDSYTLLWDTGKTTDASMVSIDKSAGNITALGRGEVTLSISADIFNGATASLSCKIIVAADPKAVIFSDVESKDLADNVIVVGTEAVLQTEASSSISKIDLLKNNGVFYDSGVIYVTQDAMKKFLDNVAKTDSKVNSSDATSLAMIIGNYTVENGLLKTVVLAKKITGSVIPSGAATFGKLKVIKMGAGGSGTVLPMVTDPGSLTNGRYLIKDPDGNVVTTATSIDKSKVYTLSVAILDNGSYDIDSEEGAVIDPLFLTSTVEVTPAPVTPVTPTPSDSGGGGGGCNAGFAGLLLMAAVPMFLRRKM